MAGYFVERSVHLPANSPLRKYIQDNLPLSSGSPGLTSLNEIVQALYDIYVAQGMIAFNRNLVYLSTDLRKIFKTDLLLRHSGYYRDLLLSFCDPIEQPDTTG
jgi:hypothetical protein